jgi:hypothetical protein
MLVDLNIQEQETLFYYYQNWQAGQNNKIHLASCHICNHGTGMHQNVQRGLNGVWIGPFSSLQLCTQYVTEQLELPANHCNFCI